MTFPAPRTVCPRATFAGEHLHHVSLRLFQFLSCSHILYSYVIFSRNFAQGQWDAQQVMALATKPNNSLVLILETTYWRRDPAPSCPLSSSHKLWWAHAITHKEVKKCTVFVSIHLLCGDFLRITAIACYLYFLTFIFQIDSCYQTGLKPSASCLCFLPAGVSRLCGLCVSAVLPHTWDSPRRSVTRGSGLCSGLVELFLRPSVYISSVI